MAHILRGKTFAIEHKPYYSLENFHGASGQDHHVATVHTASDSREKHSRLAEKLQNRKSFPLRNI